MDLKIITLSEVSQTEKINITWYHLYVKPKNNLNKLIYKPRLTQKTNLWLPEAEKEGERDKLGAWG